MTLPYSTLTPSSGAMPTATATTVTATSGTTPGQPPPGTVSPGTLGFVVVFVLAIATWLLLRNMTGRLRRMRLREQDRSAGPPVEPQDGGGGAPR